MLVTIFTCTYVVDLGNKTGADNVHRMLKRMLAPGMDHRQEVI